MLTSRADIICWGRCSMCHHNSQGRTQRDFGRGSQNPVGGVGGAGSSPAGSGAEPRKISKLILASAPLHTQDTEIGLGALV